MKVREFKGFWEGQEPEKKVITNDSIKKIKIPHWSEPNAFQYDKLIEDWKKYQRQCVITSSPKEKITWIDMAEKDTIKSYKRQQIGGILMGKSKYKMKRNRLEMEVIALRERTGDNYMLNKMVNTDGNEFFAEYTLYKDYNKYFGLTLEGDSIEVVNIMEEEFAEFLHQYRLSITYPQVQAVHEDEDEYLEVDVNDLSGLTVEEYLEYVKQGIAPIQGVGSEDALMEDLITTVAKQLIEAEQLVESKLTKFSPMYDEDDIEDEIKIDGEYDMNKLGVNVDHGSDLDIDKPYVNNPSMWTETSTNTGEMTKNSWTETPTNTSGVRAGMWKSNQPIEDRSKAELINKIVADVIEELLTKGTCSLNIALNQD